MNVTSKSSPPHETIVESPNLHIIHTQASSLNMVDVLNVQNLPLPLSSKGQTLEGQFGANNEPDIFEVPLLGGIVPRIEHHTPTCRGSSSYF